MRFNLPIWTAAYKSDRRKHNHRCKVCQKILQPGEMVVMCRQGKGCIAVHLECSEVKHSDTYVTWYHVMREWAFQHQIACIGLSFTNPKDYAKIESYRVEVGVPNMELT